MRGPALAGLAAVAVVAAACGGGGGGSSGSGALAVVPGRVHVTVDGYMQFRAESQGGARTVFWSVAPGCGAIGADGLYRAPERIPPADCRVRATSSSLGAVAEATVRVVPPVQSGR